MIQYKYANHPNNVLVRDWCNANRGRGSSLSEFLFPDIMHPKVGLGKYKCGEQFIDDEMLERAKVCIAEIESLEKAGKRKVYKTKLKGCKLETAKNVKYIEIEGTKDYEEYVNFFYNYFEYADVFKREFKLELPTTPKASNLTDPEFVKKITKAKEYVLINQLAPSKKKRKLIKAKAQQFNAIRLEALRQASLELKMSGNYTPGLARKKALSISDKEEFLQVVEEIKNDEKLSKLVPWILALTFDKNLDKSDVIYSKFIDVNIFSLVKLVNIKAAKKKASEMILNGWFEK